MRWGSDPSLTRPPDLVSSLPAGRWAHTCDHVNLEPSRDRRCLVLGGSQSAFEWAALLNEAGAASVHVVHRHESPRFAEADWSWVGPLVERFEDEPGWYRVFQRPSASAGLQALVRGPPEGRALARGSMPQRRQLPSGRAPRSSPAARVRTAPSWLISITVRPWQFDQILLATGYKADLTPRAVPRRAAISFRSWRADNGHPLLDDTLQTTVRGLFVTSLLATRDFGPFFAFTVSARTSARLVMRGLVREGIARGA